MSEHDAEQRVRQYLDWQDDGDLIASSYDENEGARHLTVTDLREVLRQLDEARSELAETRERGDRLHSTLSDVIGGYWRFGEPGYRAMQSPWIEEARFKAWHVVLAEERRLVTDPPRVAQETDHAA